MPDRRDAALLRISRLYSLALRLRDAGVCDELIVDCLEIEPEGLPALLVVAEAKLATALELDSV